MDTSLEELATRPAVRDGRIHRRSPLDGAELPSIPVTPIDEIPAMIERARHAQEGWAALPLKERADALKRAAKSMLARRSELLPVVKQEVGKLEVDGLFSEALGPLDATSSWASLLKRVAGREPIALNPISFPNKKAYVDLVPRGVVAIIAPWNYPTAGLYRSVLPALMTGNAVLLKPSELSTESSSWFAERLMEELPSGLLQLVRGDGAQGAALIEAGVDACVFTGSVATGKKVRARCAELGIPASVEMGGNDSAIVLSDCDLPRTVAGLTHWKLHNVGQACGAVEVVYVDRRVADRFVEKIGDAWAKLRTGPGDFAEVDVSPLSNARQLAVVESQVKDALAKGATLVTGGERPAGGGEGLWFQPTILDHCTDEMEVVREETFGPVLPIVRVDGPAEAIRRTNAGRYGLTASIWTQDIDRAERLAERLEVGVVTVNNHAMTGAIPALPWSGTKDTGFGIANSRYSLLTFCRPKAVVLDRAKDPEPFWMPFDPATYELGDLLSDAQIGRILRAWKIPFLIRERVGKVKKFFGF